VKEVQKEKSDNMQRLRTQFERSDPHLTFHPRLNSKVRAKQSERIAERRRTEDFEEADVVGRLLRNAHDKLERKLRTAEAISREEVEKYPFSPQLTVTKELASGSINFPGAHQSFMERQQAHLRRVRSKQETLLCEADSDPQCTLRPKIDRTSEFIVESMPQRTAESTEARCRRMSKDDHDKRTQKKAQIEAEYYGKFKHEPKINPISKELGRSASLHELAYSKERDRRLSAEALVASEEHHYSFQPRLSTSKKYSNIESDYRQGDEVLKSIELKQKEKQAKLDSLKRQKEYDELKDCVFKPNVKDKSPLITGPVVVNGLSRHMELKAMARRQEEELREREEKAFLVNVKHDPYHLYTVPQPFQLHPSNKEKRIAQIKQELVDRERAECTFQPKTLESTNRAMISRLLRPDFHNSLLDS
jgi:hypothetical protein